MSSLASSSLSHSISSKEKMKSAENIRYSSAKNISQDSSQDSRVKVWSVESNTSSALSTSTMGNGLSRNVFSPNNQAPYIGRRGGSYAKRASSFDGVRHQDLFNTKAISNQLLDIVLYMEAIPKRALSELGSLIRNFHVSESERKRRWLTMWTDPRGLDLLQCAIVSQRADIIHLLLLDAKLFPQNHYPKLNPYAHLAATLGSTKCLDAVLTYRSKDYFPASSPQHMVKLPPDIARRFKCGQSHGMINKHLDKVVRVVREEAAKAAKQSLDMLAHSITFDEEIKSIDESFKEETKSPKRRLCTRHPDTGTQHINKVNFFVNTTNTAAQVQSRVESSNTMLPIKKKVVSKVTVHRDIFSHADFTTRPEMESVRNVISENPPLQHLEKEQLNQFSKIPLDNNSVQEMPHSLRPLQHSGPRPVVAASSRKRLSRPSGQIRKPNTPVQSCIEFGVRRIKRYKKFRPVLDASVKSLHVDDPSRYMGKTPLTVAAEKNQYDCVKYLLKKYHTKKAMPGTVNNFPLTLATGAKCIEAIATLARPPIALADYQSAVSLSFRQGYPEGLSVLLNLGGKNRQHLFDGDNLYHVMYSKTYDNIDVLPEMTRVLINSREDVNAKNQTRPRKYPMYTLIQSAFRVTDGAKSLYYVTCLRMLLDDKANPHHDEEAFGSKFQEDVLNLSRPAYNSAIHCIMANAHGSLKYFENSRWSLIIMQKFIETLETRDKTPRRVLNDVLFLYMNYVNELGLNRRVLRTLLRYGANPDHIQDGRFPLNVFFEEMCSFLIKFKVEHKLFTYDAMLETVLILCQAMRPNCLHRAVVHFLDNHLLSTPLQALDITRKFCYHANTMIMHPRSLRHTASLYIWIRVRRNPKNVRRLPITEELMNNILP